MEMNRKGALVRVITWSSILILIVIGGDSRLAEAKNEVRSVPSPAYVQSRPVYHKPVIHKPKLLLPKQLQQQKSDVVTSSLQFGSNPHLITQTVYGFLDFVTTVGNTVMIFTPQTKKVDLIQPSSSLQMRETVVLQPTQPVALDIEDLTTTTDVTKSSTHIRTPRLLDLDEENAEEVPLHHILQTSEYEPQVFRSVIAPTPGSSSDLEYVNLMADSNSARTQLTTVTTPKVAIVTSESEPEVRSEVKVVTAVKIFETSTTSTVKGFTLKFSRPASAPLASTLTKISTATAIRQPEEEFPTGLVSHNVETKVNNGVTTVHETKVLGTFIGTQYARVLESSSSVLPKVVTASRAPPTTTIHSPTTTSRIFPKLVESVSEKVEFSTQRSVSSSGDLENDERFNEELLEHEEGPTETFGLDEEEIKLKSSVIDPTPTATASEESTLYILPQRDQKAQIYASPTPSPNAYSRQPEIYVDVSPAKAFDYIVTATPSKKPFRPQTQRSTESSRFTNRFNKSPSTTTESNELVIPYESTSEDNSRRSPTRFRNNRNRSSLKTKQIIPEVDILPTTVSVYSNNAVTGTLARKFNSRSRSTNNSPNAGKSGQEFKLGGRGGYSPASVGRQLITPTSSTSVYRFKLNRPTGRWRFKPSPKPKVNIIKTKEDDEANPKEILQASNSNGAVYPQGYNEHGETLEIQNVEETRAESNELGQDVEPELVPQTLRVATVTPTEFTDFENTRFLEIATIRSPYVFQAGNVKNTRYITVTKTFTKEMIVPTQASSSFGDASLENILATRAPYEKILEGSNNVATLPLIILGSDTATPPLETVTQTFSTTQLMLKTSILPVLYEGVTTLYTLTQSYFITRLVTAHKTIPPMELFNFVPTKSLTEFNTALQEAGSEHREQLIGSESDENDGNNEHFVTAPDELTSVGSDFDPSSMDEKFPRNSIVKNHKVLIPVKSKQPDQAGLPDLSNLSPEQLAFLRYFANGGQQQQGGLIPMQNYFQSPLLPSIQPHFPVQFASSPVIFNTVTTVVETKTLRIQFGSKPTQTTIYSTKIIPTRVTSYITASVPATPAIPNFFQPAPYPLAYVG